MRTVLNVIDKDSKKLNIWGVVGNRAHSQARGPIPAAYSNSSWVEFLQCGVEGCLCELQTMGSFQVVIVGLVFEFSIPSGNDHGHDENEGKKGERLHVCRLVCAVF